jgi:hypothetical protein
MRSKLAQAVRKQFGSRLSDLLPRFREVPAPSKGDRLYQWKVDRSYWVYVLVHPHHLGDVFVVEVAWTKGKPFPGGYSKPTGSSEKAFERFRLYELWNERAPLDLWWIGGRPKPDPETARVPPPRAEADLLKEAEAAATDAVERMASFGVPYLSKIAKQLGHGMHSSELTDAD